MDESGYSIEDGFFAAKVLDDIWQNYPASRHGRGASVSFADGHAQVKQWLEPSTAELKDPALNSPAPRFGSRRNRDLQWITERYIDPL